VKRFLFAIACCVSVSIVSASFGQKLSLVVESTHDHQHVPVTVVLPVSPNAKFTNPVQITNQAGHRFVGQFTSPSLLTAEPPPDRRPLNFVLPEVRAGQPQTLVVDFDSPISDRDASFVWDDNPGKFSQLSIQNRPVLKYVYEALDASSPERRELTYKVFHHVFDPTGTFLVTKGAGGLYPHHRGLFFGFNRISYGSQQADTWHCHHGESQTHESFRSMEAGPVLGRHRVAIDWRGRNGQVFAKEERELTGYNIPGGTLIEFASRLKSVVGPVRLDGDPQHAGFQFRGAQEIAELTKDQTYYLRPDGKDRPGSFRNWTPEADQVHVDLPWNAQSFVVHGQRLTCCYFDRPENPKSARFSERDYGRFGSYFEFDLTNERPLEVNYRIWLQAGEMDVVQVAAKHADFIHPPQVRIVE
jgi:hypothetical protein